MTKKVHSLGIDVFTSSVPKLVQMLRELKSTVTVHNAGQYAEGCNYSQIHIETTKNIDKLDGWLYKHYHHRIDYVAVFERSIK